MQTLDQLSIQQKRDLLTKLLAEKNKQGQTSSLLSYGQQALWFLHTSMPNSASYHLKFSFRVKNLNVVAIKRAMQNLINRHPALRSTFVEENGEPIQIFHAHSNIDFETIDAVELNDTEMEADIVKNYRRPFNLTTGPVFRVSVFTRAKAEHILLIAVHHVVFEAWSLRIMLNDLKVLYQSEINGVVSSLLPMLSHYKDYVYFQRQFLKSIEGERLKHFWIKKLADANYVLDLPIDKQRPVIQSYSGNTYSFILPSILSKQIIQLAKSENVTLYTFLLSAYAVLLHRYTRQNDFLIGTPTSGRSKPEFSNIIGYFINVVVLRIQLSKNLTFKELLHVMHAEVLSCLAHQEYPFSLLVKQLNLVRDLSRPPLYQAGFVLQQPQKVTSLEVDSLGTSDDQHQINWGDVVIEPFRVKRYDCQVDLSLEMHRVGELLAVEIVYASDLFSDVTITHMAEHFQEILLAAVENPAQRISHLNMLTAKERKHFNASLNPLKSNAYTQKTFPDLFAEQVVKYPNNIAISFEKASLTYQELNYKSDQFAFHLQKLGVKAETFIAVSLDRSLQMLIALIGIMKSGGAYIPLDPHYPRDRLKFILEETQVQFLVVDNTTSDLFKDYLEQKICIDNYPSEEASYLNASDLSSLMYVLYTSGSTGKPKGVLVEHGAVMHCLQNIAEKIKIKSDDNLLALTTISFDISNLELLLPLLYGATVTLVSQSIRNDAQELTRLFNQISPTLMQATPATWQMLIESGWQGNANLKILCGGERLTEKLRDGLLSRCSQLWNVYGPTETTIWSAIESISANKKIYLGEPVGNTQLLVLDDYLNPVPVGVPGELFIGGEGVARGYFNRGELSRDKFILNPFFEEGLAVLYRTGDLVRYDAFYNLEFIGRLDNQIKLRGFRIELSEIKSVIDQQPEIVESAVVVKEDDEGEKIIVAYVVYDAPTISPNKLKRQLKVKLAESLPSYMLPSQIFILKKLPLTANKKIDIKALLDIKYNISDHKNRLTNSLTENTLIEIWSELLGIPEEEIKHTDNFFHLGGHSLLATRLVSRIRETHSIELPLVTLFMCPTIELLAIAIESSQQNKQLVQLSELIAQARDKNILLSFAQQRLWFLQQLIPDKTTYNIPMALELTGKLELCALKQALQSIINRHEILRTHFQTSGEMVYQIIADTFDVTIDFKSLSNLSFELRAAELELEIKHASAFIFELEKLPLLYVKLIKMEENLHVLLITLHHSIADLWSLSILGNEVTSFYNYYAYQTPLTLNPLPVQYADFSIWQRQFLQGAVFKKELHYWQLQLANAPSVLNLPIAKSRKMIVTHQAKTVELLISATLGLQLKKLSQDKGVTLFMLLLASIQTLLYRYTGQDDIIIGCPIANRTLKQTEDLIGFFVNTLALRTQFSDDLTFLDVLNQVKETTLDAYAHQHIPFEQLVEHLKIDRDVNRNPLFQIMFALQNTVTPALQLHDITVTSLPINNQQAKFDLTFTVDELLNDDLICKIEYTQDLFYADDIKRMANHLTVLLKSIGKRSGTFLRGNSQINFTELN